MVQFSLTLQRGDIILGNNVGELRTVRKLSNEWSFLCHWNENVNTRYLKPVSVEFRRLSSTDIVSLSGAFQIGTSSCFYESGDIHSGEIKPTQKFTKCMEPGSSSVEIEVQYTDRESFSKDYRFHIDVTITSLTHSDSGKCQKCAQFVELGNDLGRLLKPETSCFADVTLKCGNEYFPAHKAILSARSPVFADMFKNPVKANCENEVVINDVDAPLLRQMLYYVYTAKLSGGTVFCKNVPLHPEAVKPSDLYIAADKYQLDDLKAVCCEFLKDNISLEISFEILRTEDLYDNDLKYFAIEYIGNTCKELTVLEQTEEWKTMRKERPDLAVDILTSVLKAKELKI